MLDKVNNELEMYTGYVDIRTALLLDIFASFTKEEIDEKIALAKEYASQVKNKISFEQFIQGVKDDVARCEESMASCKVLTWVKKELEKESSDKNTKEETKA
jgi:hypothetical protein